MHYTGSEGRGTPLHPRCSANHRDGKTVGILLFSSSGHGREGEDSFPISLVLLHFGAAGINNSEHQAWKEWVQPKPDTAQQLLPRISGCRLPGDS